MKTRLSTFISLINIISSIINALPLQRSSKYKHFIKKTIIYFFSIFFLINGYIFGSIALYYYLLPYWGESLSALSLCLLFIVMSFTFVIAGKLLKSKDNQSPLPLSSLVEKSLHHIPNFQEFTKIVAQASPKVLLTILGIIVVATCTAFCKKKDK